ncbi:hypothetical protein CBR_g4823 [Chara braunii]|uniref:Metallo-beta-lactamase domain-containing protein n=1 Tax=Chara braunii TaxID=69332 RepID=A0A388KIW3_CHABU|nr:hypothetical protein CBR_g4823 [Chara braunii]|eukprot:GBG69995.1 hypothetical protein CBR_g4823 [Chara braunii]
MDEVENLKVAGNTAFKRGRFEMAADFYLRAIEIVEEGNEADLAPLRSNLSFALLKLDQPQEALVEADKCIDLKESWSKGHFRKAEALFALKNYAGAELSYQRALELLMHVVTGGQAPNDDFLRKRLSLIEEAKSGFYFRQLVPGRDFAVSSSSFIENQLALWLSCSWAMGRAQTVLTAESRITCWLDLQMDNHIADTTAPDFNQGLQVVYMLALGTLGYKPLALSLIFVSAQQMRNLVYAVGDARTRECFIIDAAWDVKGIRRFLASENMKLVGAIVTHYHFDHTGGPPPAPFDVLGIHLPGAKELAMQDEIPIYVNKHDAEILVTKNKVPATSIIELEDNSELYVGEIKLKFLHTPGHTPGSQCILLENIPGCLNDKILITGDTLFKGTCGRLDLPDCDVKAMYNSLQKVLAKMGDDVRVFPGHDYGGARTTIACERQRGYLKTLSEDEWMHMHCPPEKRAA